MSGKPRHCHNRPGGGVKTAGPSMSSVQLWFTSSLLSFNIPIPVISLIFLPIQIDIFPLLMGLNKLAYYLRHYHDH